MCVVFYKLKCVRVMFWFSRICSRRELPIVNIMSVARVLSYVSGGDIRFLCGGKHFPPCFTHACLVKPLEVLWLTDTVHLRCWCGRQHTGPDNVATRSRFSCHPDEEWRPLWESCGNAAWIWLVSFQSSLSFSVWLTNSASPRTNYGTASEFLVHPPVHMMSYAYTL